MMDTDFLSKASMATLKALLTWAEMLYSREVERMLYSRGDELVETKGRALLAQEIYLLVKGAYEERRKYERE